MDPKVSATEDVQPLFSASLRGIDDSLTDAAMLCGDSFGGSSKPCNSTGKPVVFKSNAELFLDADSFDVDHVSANMSEGPQNSVDVFPPIAPPFELFGADFNNLFGNNDCSFPEDWSPLSSVAGNDNGSGGLSEVPSDEPQAGTSFHQSATSNDLLFGQGPTISAARQDAVFARSLLTNCDAVGIKLPWETEFYSDLFGDAPINGLIPKMPVSDVLDVDLEAGPQAVASAVASVARFSNANPVHTIFVKCSDDVQFHVKRQQMRDAAIGKLLIVVRHCLLASSTGRHIIALGTDVQQQAGAHEIVDAVVGIRSSATLVKRANSLLSFLRWFAKQGIDDVNPFDEKYIWMYFQFLRETCAPATRADSALSAFRFACHILGFECLSAAVKSRRLVGACELMLAGKRLLRQAKPLTVLQIGKLHTLLNDVDVNIVDRAVVAYILFALYGRCRNSDLQMIHSLQCDYNEDGGFVIIETCNHKSGRKAALKTKLMPIIVPARGVDGTVWVDSALKVFDCACVDLQNPIDGPLMHAPLEGVGSFMSRGFRSNEVSSMLRRFLELDEPGPGNQEEIVSSHSLKATMLAWCSRYGLSPASRSMLGRHTSSLNETYAIYSRDLVCAPVAELQKVIDAVCQGAFHPDSQRSEFFRPPVNGDCENREADRCAGNSGVYTPAPSTPYEPSVAEGFEKIGEMIPRVSEELASPALSHPGTDDAFADQKDAVMYNSDSDSSSSNGDEMSSDDSDMVEPPARVKRFRAKIPKEEKWYVHSKSHLVHRFEGNMHNDVSFLVCGKVLSSAYILCTEATAWNVLCRSCNRR
eukprot:s405_g9.t1